MNLGEQTWPQVENYLQKDRRILIPIGSTEQHGPSGLIGTDYMTAEYLAAMAGSRTNVMVAPTICYGMAAHHMAFPGTATLSPQTLIQVIAEIVQSFAQHGFRHFLFVNGHGGNIAVLTSAFCQLKMNDNDWTLEALHWWQIPEVVAYEKEHYSTENGFHATISEVAATQVICPHAFSKQETVQFPVSPKTGHWPLSAREMRSRFPDGRISSNPGRATPEHGQNVIDIAVNAIVQKISTIDALLQEDDSHIAQRPKLNGF
jgi:creatinine amidohydrolase